MKNKEEWLASPFHRHAERLKEMKKKEVFFFPAVDLEKLLNAASLPQEKKNNKNKNDNNKKKQKTVPSIGRMAEEWGSRFQQLL